MVSPPNNRRRSNRSRNHPNNRRSNSSRSPTPPMPMPLVASDVNDSARQALQTQWNSLRNNASRGQLFDNFYRELRERLNLPTLHRHRHNPNNIQGGTCRHRKQQHQRTNLNRNRNRNERR